jgi:hypothetical protein
VDDIAIQDFWGRASALVAWRFDRSGVLGSGAGSALTETTTADMRKEIEDLFAGWPEPVARIIQATPAHAIRLIAVHDLEPLHTWSRANVLLVGDAAHAPLPTSGQVPARHWKMHGIWPGAWMAQAAAWTKSSSNSQKSAVPRLPSWSNRDGSCARPVCDGPRNLSHPQRAGQGIQSCP